LEEKVEAGTVGRAVGVNGLARAGGLAGGGGGDVAENRAVVAGYEALVE